MVYGFAVPRKCERLEQDFVPIRRAFTLKTMILTLEWTSEGVRFIDQTKLPLEESYVLATSYQQVADVIVTMVVRLTILRQSSIGFVRSWRGLAPQPSISFGPSTA